MINRTAFYGKWGAPTFWLVAARLENLAEVRRLIPPNTISRTRTIYSGAPDVLWFLCRVCEGFLSLSA